MLMHNIKFKRKKGISCHLLFGDMQAENLEGRTAGLYNIHLKNVKRNRIEYTNIQKEIYNFNLP